MAGWSEKTTKSRARIATTTTARLTINPDTTDEIVLAAPHDEGGPSAAEPRRRRWWIIPVGVLVVAAIVAAFIRLPYDTIAPGSTREVNDLVLIRGTQSFPPKGKVMYTTVSVRERVTPYEALVGWLDPNISVESEKSVRGNTPPQQFQQENVAAMADSKKVAEAVALEHLGYKVIQGNGAVVRSVRANTPATNLFQPNDVIVGVDDKPVAIDAQAVDAIKAHKPGENVKLTVLRGGGPPRDIQAKLGTGPDGKGFLGVVMETAGLQVKPPFEILIDSGTVVGPSAGVAYALELLDQLTPGELTGGTKIAATGDLHLDGTIGAIGGVAQKVVTARRAGAKAFLVPKDNYEQAKAHAGDLRVYAVGTIDDAISVLGTIKGSNAHALPRPSPGT